MLFGSTGMLISFASSQALASCDICTSIKLQNGKEGSEEQKTGLGMLAKKTHRRVSHAQNYSFASALLFQPLVFFSLIFQILYSFSVRATRKPGYVLKSYILSYAS